MICKKAKFNTVIRVAAISLIIAVLCACFSACSKNTDGDTYSFPFTKEGSERKLDALVTTGDGYRAVIDYVNGQSSYRIAYGATLHSRWVTATMENGWVTGAAVSQEEGLFRYYVYKKSTEETEGELSVENVWEKAELYGDENVAFAVFNQSAAATLVRSFLFMPYNAAYLSALYPVNLQANVAGRKCGEYSAEYSGEGENINADFFVDDALGVCLKYVLTEANGSGTTKTTYEVVSFDVSFTPPNFTN